MTEKEKSGKSDKAASQESAGVPVNAILDRLGAIEAKISEIPDLRSENSRLMDDLRGKEREIAARDAEIERLRQDLLHQEKLLEREVEDRARVLDEKRAVLDREVAEKISNEREEFELRLELERQAWSERLALAEQRHAAAVAEMRSKEGFWARLLRLLTWS